MMRLLSTFAVLALAAPAIASSSSITSAQLSQDIGKSVMDRQSNKIGTIEYQANINGRQAAVMIVPTKLYGDAIVALPITDLQPAKNGNGVTVSMGVNDLVRIPCALPPCSMQNAAAG